MSQIHTICTTPAEAEFYLLIQSDHIDSRAKATPVQTGRCTWEIPLLDGISHEAVGHAESQIISYLPAALTRKLSTLDVCHPSFSLQQGTIIPGLSGVE